MAAQDRADRAGTRRRMKRQGNAGWSSRDRDHSTRRAPPGYVPLIGYLLGRGRDHERR